MCVKSPPDRGQIDARSGADRGPKAPRSRRDLKPDGRSSGARRLRDLIKAFSDEIGGELTESEASLVRQAAALTLRCEQLQAAISRGEEVDDDLLIRISGTGKRLLSSIAKRAADKKPTGETLQEYFARRGAEKAALEEAEADEDEGDDT
jgi:hypothetical protein